MPQTSNEVPAELQQALDADVKAAEIFHALAPSHRAEYSRWIAEAKKPETRSARAAKTVELIKSKKTR